MYYRPHSSKYGKLFKEIRFCKAQTAKLRFFAIILAALFLLIYANTQLGGLLAKAMETQMLNIYTNSVNEAIGDVMKRNSELSDTVVELERAQDGSICALSTNTAALNILKSELSTELASKLRELEDEAVYIPLGTLTGIEALAGSGPDIRIRLRLIGGVSTDMRSSFVDAGVNQTLHTINCSVSARFLAIMPGARTKLSLDTTAILAQSIIVGAVPDSYTVVNGDTSDTIGRIFDYGDPYGEDVE